MKTVKNRLSLLLAGLFMASSVMTVYAAEFKVTVPTGTKECYVVGNPDWNSFLKMNGSGTSFSLTTTAIDGTAFKYCSGPEWKYVEVKEDGTDIENRTSPGNPDQVVKWKETYNPAPPAPVEEPKDLVISVYKEGSTEQRTNFVKVPGTSTYEYEAQVTIEGYTGNPKDYRYWVGANKGWQDGKSCNFQLGAKNSTETGCNGKVSAYAADNFLTTCSSGIFTVRIYALTNDGKEQTSPNYYPHAVKEEKVAGLVLTSSVPSYETSDLPANISLSVIETEAGSTEGAYKWFYSTDKTNWKPLPGAGSGSTVVLQPNAFPAETTYYQVKRKLKGETELIASNIRPIVVVQACGENTKGKKIYKEDFGQLNSIKDRSSFPGMSAKYKYRPYPQKINDGQYALVATPYYCGCGEGGGEEGEKSVETCEGNNMWFRQFLSDGFTPMRDHTLNNLTDAGPYGAMLMINYATSVEDKVAFQHVLTAEEKAQFSPNSILRFSAWFASAAKKEATGVLVNMALKIEFKAYGTSAWQQKAIIITKVGYNDDWMRGEAELVLDEKDGDYRITIENYAGGGYGNDVLIDDISLDLCVPSFGVYFYEDNQDKTSVILDDVSSSVPVRVENMDFGTVGVNPCMMLFRYDETATQKYTYVADMALDAASKYYIANVSGADLVQVPGTSQFQAVASAAPCNDAVKEGVEKGTITPGTSDAYIFSGNKVNMTVFCNDLSLTQSIAPKAVCLNEKVKYTVALKNLSKVAAQNVKVKLNWDNSVLKYIQSTTPTPGSRFDTATQEWILSQSIAKDAEVKLVMEFEMIKKSPTTAPAQVSSYVSSLGTSTWNSYDKQASTMKGISEAITKEVATIELYVAEDPSVCPGESVTIQAQTNQPNPIFRWYDMNGKLLATQPKYTTPTLTENTSYKVTLETNDLCETPLSEAEVSEVDMKPVLTKVTVTPMNETVSVGSAITKQVSVEPAGIPFEATWFANGQNLNLPQEQALAPQLKPFVATQYKVVAQAECNSVETETSVKVEWPTVFTPYTVDGKNDDFLSHMDPAFPVVIFDRYGNKIAETGDGWDGTMSNGKKAMPGVYFYIVTLPDGHLQKGTIEIYQD